MPPPIPDPSAPARCLRALRGHDLDELEAAVELAREAHLDRLRARLEQRLAELRRCAR